MSVKNHEVGSGVMVKLEGNILHLTVDLNTRQGPSKSGKSTVVATTKGIIKAPGDSGVMYGFNAFVK